MSACRIVGIALIVAAPLAIHAAIATSTWTQLIVVIPVAQLLILGTIAAFRDPARIKWLGPLAAILALAIVWAERSGLSLTAMPGLPHAMAYSALLLGFGYTLLPGQEAILTRAVAAVRGPLPAEMIVHTRRVTLAWCCFFAAQLIGSVVLYFFAPLEVWSFFINVLNLPLVVLMFVAEGLYRFFRFRDFPMDRFSDILRVVAKTTEKRTQQADAV
ncbi:MAG TPA: hypothetical protein VNF99_20335 [Stellaceae bacterium]|nr:hypothetical protein [Stellaceae bacterium]